MVFLGRLFIKTIVGVAGIAAEKIERRFDPPIMKEHVNAGSEKFAEWERQASAQDALKHGFITLGETPRPAIPDELELVHNLWRPKKEPTSPDTLPDPTVSKNPE